MVLDTAPLNAA